MIEIFVIWRLAVHIGDKAAEKGLKKRGYQVMAILLWVCGEFFGGMLSAQIFGPESELLLRYAAALLGAIAGAGIALLVMKLVPDEEMVSDLSQTETVQISSPAKNFGRSGWIPALVVFACISCLCVVGVGIIFSQVISTL